MVLLSDMELKSLIMNKNERILRHVMEEYTPLVKFVVKKYIRDEFLVEECVSDIFFSVWENIIRFNPDKNTFKNWLVGVSRYKAIDYYRKDIREKSRIENSDKELNSEDEYKVFYDGLEGLIRCLNEEQKKVIILRFEEDLKPKEIARLLGKNIKEVYNLIERSKKIIKKQKLEERRVYNEK